MLALSESSELIAFWATIGGAVVGSAALVVAVLIYCWTTNQDDERHGELTDALSTTGDALAELLASSAVQQTDLSPLSSDMRTALLEHLTSNEKVVKLERPGEGRKGNHPWFAVTSLGRTLKLYVGGRRGGVHVTDLGA